MVWGGVLSCIVGDVEFGGVGIWVWLLGVCELWVLCLGHFRSYGTGHFCLTKQVVLFLLRALVVVPTEIPVES